MLHASRKVHKGCKGRRQPRSYAHYRSSGGERVCPSDVSWLVQRPWGYRRREERNGILRPPREEDRPGEERRDRPRAWCREGKRLGADERLGSKIPMERGEVLHSQATSEGKELCRRTVCERVRRVYTQGKISIRVQCDQRRDDRLRALQGKRSQTMQEGGTCMVPTLVM